VNLLSERRRWPIAELEKRINSEHFEEAVQSLEDVGLLKREDDVIFATPAAIRGDDLAL
jgi:predicted transcriptional regulator